MNKHLNDAEAKRNAPLIDISIVSHGHGAMVGRLVDVLEGFPEVGRIIVTRNIEDSDGVLESTKTVIIQNENPKGFGANHNAAFLRSHADWFCVINPDVELNDNPFPALLMALRCSDAALIAPLVLNSLGQLEDSFRCFPKIRKLVLKFFSINHTQYPVDYYKDFCSVDWVAGMFMLFWADSFQNVGGFDERFFLYYEDADICTRLWKSSYPVMICTKAKVVHDAQRTSHRNFQYMKWHISSMVLYFWKHWRRLPKRDGNPLHR